VQTSSPTTATAEAQQLPLVDETTQYALDVTEGRIIAGPWVRLACKRHLNDLEDGPSRGLKWFPPKAAHVYTFFACLQLFDGDKAGQPFTLEPAQQFIVGSIFGWINDDGSRRFRTAYVEIGKGNGKTPLAAGIGLYVTVVESVRNPGAEVYAAAVNQDQAKICHRDAENFVSESPALRRRVIKTVNNLAYPRGKAYFRPVSAEGRGLDGKRVACAIVDELHEHPSAIVVDKMDKGTKGRRDALIFEITNSGYDRNSVCFHHHDYSVKVLQGMLDQVQSAARHVDRDQVPARAGKESDRDPEPAEHHGAPQLLRLDRAGDSLAADDRRAGRRRRLG
jgi:phage terminase large subunit-like protein